MNDTTMLGTYTLDGNIPVEPEIVLANCTDTAMAGQLISAFQGNPDIRFFLMENVDENSVDLNADFHFIRDHGNWVLANHDTLLNVLFDDAGFNPGGSEGTFSLDALGSDMPPVIGDEMDQLAYMANDDQLLVDMHSDDLLVSDHAPVHADGHAETFFVDPSVLAQGEHEILVSDFTLGQDTLELPDGLSIKDVVVDTEHDLTQVILGGADATDDIVVKLLGTHQHDLPSHDFGLHADASGDDLINHMIHSGLHSE